MLARFLQELFPTEPPIIDVQFIRVNLTVSKAALWGPNGAAIIDIPKRWGAKGAFQGGKDTIMTRLVYLFSFRVFA